MLEGFGWKPEILGQQPRWRKANPVADAEGAELGKVAVVEDEDEVARLVAQGLDNMAVAAREIPDISRLKVVGLAAAERIDDRGAHPAFGDEGPLCGGGVPVKLAHHARLHAHGDAGQPLGYR